jgi:hypothetical protein
LENNFIESRKPRNHADLLSDDKDLDEETFNIIGHARDSAHHRLKKQLTPNETCHLSTGQNIINVGPIGENLIWLEQARRMTRKTNADCAASKEDVDEKKIKAQPAQAEGDDKGINLNVNINLNFNILNEFDEEVDNNQSSNKPRKGSSRRQQSHSKQPMIKSTSPTHNVQFKEPIPVELASNDAFVANVPGNSNERSSLAPNRIATQSSVVDIDNKWRETKDAIINLPGP